MKPIKCSNAGAADPIGWARAGRTLRLALAGMLALAACLGGVAQERHRIALVAGSELPGHQTTRGMGYLKAFLEKNYPFECVLITSSEEENTFANLQALRDADSAVFLVRRKTPSADDLALFREFFNSGKGFVALASTSHAFENWKTFDSEVLGATYTGPFAEHTTPEVINPYAHPIFTEARDFVTDSYVYNFTDLAENVQILMEGTVGEATAPMAWTRTYKGGRLFYFSPGGINLFQDRNYQRIVGNALLWVLRQPIPGAETAVQRSYLPEAHPGAFAVTFPQGPGLCYDPVRGGMNYIWDGGFADLRPRWITKRGSPVAFAGDVFYREQTEFSLRSDRGRLPEYQFLGYKMAAGFPEFRFRLDGREIRETLKPSPRGTGVVRHFQVEGDAPLWLRLDEQPDAEIQVTGAIRQEGWIHYPGEAGGGEFTVVIRRK